MQPKISVVIPYYQREPGILRKAVVSAIRQTGVGPMEIIVVDDSSPVPARNELRELITTNSSQIRIVEQANAGPAAARNTGLANVSDDTEYVAFLDSDDEWMDEHLHSALLALGQGYDFYFADHFQLNQSVSAFKRAGRIQVEEHQLLNDATHLYRYIGDMFDQILRGNVIGTSTVVYRYHKLSTVRFREEFVYAGEDYLFWLELSRLTELVVFSDQCECTCGPGVNVFAGSGWGTEKSLIRTHHEIKYRKAVAKLFPLNAEQARHNRTILRGLRRHFIADILHRLRHRKPVDRAILAKQLRIDPATYWMFVPTALSILLRRT